MTWGKTSCSHGSFFLLQHLICLRHFCSLKLCSVDFHNELYVVRCTFTAVEMLKRLSQKDVCLSFPLKQWLNINTLLWYTSIYSNPFFFWHQVIHIFKSLLLLIHGNGCDLRGGNPHKPHRLSHSDPILVFALCIINAILSPVTYRLLCQWS